MMGMVLYRFLPKKEKPIIVKMPATIEPEIGRRFTLISRMENSDISPTFKNVAPAPASRI